MDKKILKDLGLTNNEIEVYLSLLRLNSGTANDISSKTGMHRQAIYDSLERLIEKGFVSYVLKNNTKYFSAVKPETIVDFLEEKKRNFQSLLPELLKITSRSDEETTVELYKGKNVVRTEFRIKFSELQRRKGEALVFGSDETEFKRQDAIAIEQYLSKLRKNKLKEKVIVSEREKTIFSGEQTDYRRLSGKFFSPIPMSVVGNKLFMTIFGDPNYLLVVENKKLAGAYRKQFFALWQMAKPLKK